MLKKDKDFGERVETLKRVVLKDEDIVAASDLARFIVENNMDEKEAAEQLGIDIIYADYLIHTVLPKISLLATMAVSKVFIKCKVSDFEKESV